MLPTEQEHDHSQVDVHQRTRSAKNQGAKSSPHGASKAAVVVRRSNPGTKKSPSKSPTKSPLTFKAPRPHKPSVGKRASLLHRPAPAREAKVESLLPTQETYDPNETEAAVAAEAVRYNPALAAATQTHDPYLDNTQYSALAYEKESSSPPLFYKRKGVTRTPSPLCTRTIASFGVPRRCFVHVRSCNNLRPHRHSKMQVHARTMSSTPPPRHSLL